MINPTTDATILVNPDRTIVSANPRAADIVLTTVTRWKGTSLDTRHRSTKKPFTNSMLMVFQRMSEMPHGIRLARQYFLRGRSPGGVPHSFLSYSAGIG
jgi:alpha-D-ribose 1-methylphosphonate 5-phosphate C-P lyase